MKIYTVDEAKLRLEAYCAYQERCHKEVTNKLRQMGMIPLAVDAIVAHLIEHNFLNETRFAKSFARGKFRQKKWGKNRIRQELKWREISAVNIRLALSEIDEAEYNETFHALAEKRASQILETNTLKAKKKLADYLLYRGWESQWVYEKIADLYD
ncbi:MAG: regulatory protein RecX [Capnocytophaga sp.]|nr:regulatory protein RecX [Capnocytophaga sp.]